MPNGGITPQAPNPKYYIMKKTNIIKATMLPFISASLMLSKRQRLLPVSYGATCPGIVSYLSQGEYLNAMQRADSVGNWNDSPQGRWYWDNIRTKLERGDYGDF